MSNITLSHAATDHDLQKMLLHRQVQVNSWLEFFSRKPPHIHQDLVEKQARNHVFIAKHHLLNILQLQLLYRRVH